jgi:hypothetical protein
MGLSLKVNLSCLFHTRSFYFLFGVAQAYLGDSLWEIEQVTVFFNELFFFSGSFVLFFPAIHLHPTLILI